jgi:hypothetical protein
VTVALAWIGKRRDDREHLYIASDSRTRGVHVLDLCPKILTLPRSDCALCFAGDTADTYPMMLQLAYAIAAHEPARDRSLDVARVKDHLLRLFTDIIRQIRDPATPFRRSDAQFLFAGYSWRQKDFRIWTIHYVSHKKEFEAREAKSFNARLRKAAFIGDWGTRIRNSIARELATTHGGNFYLEPLRTLSEFLSRARANDSIGGAPQLIRITQHMSTRPLCVRWRDTDTLLGRPLFAYENADYWIVDPMTGKFRFPRKFGMRWTDSEQEIDEAEGV